MKLVQQKIHGVVLAFIVFVVAALCFGCGQPGTTKKIINSANPNDPTNQLALGYKFFLGEEVPRNLVKAAEFFRKAADAGNAEAQCALGSMYQNGMGVSINYLEATQWHAKAAKQGYADSQFLLGLSYRDGTGVIKDSLEAYKWLHLAADQGDFEHIEARDSLALFLTPDMVAEGRRRADEFTRNKAVASAN